jgi:hypothetical protein
MLRSYLYEAANVLLHPRRKVVDAGLFWPGGEIAAARAARQEFRHLYVLARQCQAEDLADEILEIADDSARRQPSPCRLKLTHYPTIKISQRLLLLAVE